MHGLAVHRLRQKVSRMPAVGVGQWFELVNLAFKIGAVVVVAAAVAVANRREYPMMVMMMMCLCVHRGPSTSN